MILKKFNELNESSYSKEEVIKLIQDYYIMSLGKFDPETDEERNFTNPSGRNYINLNIIKSKVVNFMQDK